jgi:hypothetical protein
MSKIKKAKFTRDYIDNPQTTTYKKLIELEDKFDLEKGDKGDKGERGFKGEKGDKGDKGEQGEQGLQGIKGEQGENGLDGKDGSPDTPNQIADKLNTLTEKVEIKVIKDLEKRLNEKKKEVIKEIPKSKSVERYIQTIAGGGGASYFTQLNDTPSSYTGDANKLVSVKGDESGLEFSTGETILDPIYVRRDGTTPLTANWDAGSYKITAQQLESDIATGTAPLIVASTTLVSNLNSDLLDGQHGTYYVDIVNDTTPQLGGNLASNGYDILMADNDKAIFGTGNDLEIYSDGNDGIIRQLTQDKDIIYYVNDGGVDTEVIRLQGATGNVGIGNNNPTGKLHIKDGSTEVLYADSSFFGVGTTSPTTIDGGTFNGEWEFQKDQASFSMLAITNNDTSGSGNAGAIFKYDDAVALLSVRDFAVFYGSLNDIDMRLTQNNSWAFRITSTEVESRNTKDFRVDDGTLFVDASTNRVGMGTTSPNAQLHTTKGRIVKVDRYTSTTTLNADNHQVFGDTDGGAFTINLPAGVEGTYYRIVNTGSSGNNLTISPNGLELLLGVNASFNLADGESLIIVFHPTEGWF